MDSGWARRVEAKIDAIHKKVVEQRDEEIQRISKLERGLASIWWLLSVSLVGVATVVAKMLGLL